MPTLEERVAALEARLDALAPDGEPEGYYTHKYTGEEMDALLDRVAAMAETREGG